MSLTNPHKDIKKPEFGNTAHIKLMNDHKLYEQEVLDGSVNIFDHKKIDVQITVRIAFPCAECGDEIYVNISSEEKHTKIREDTISFILYESAVRCDNCQCTYELTDGDINMLSNPTHPEKLSDEITPEE